MIQPIYVQSRAFQWVYNVYTGAKESECVGSCAFARDINGRPCHFAYFIPPNFCHMGNFDHTRSE